MKTEQEKATAREYQKRYRLLAGDKVRANARKSYEKNKTKNAEKIRLRNQAWRDAHPEQMRKIRENWVNNNKEYDRKRRAEKQKARRAANPEKYKQQLAEWRLKNHDKVLEQGRRWREKNRVELAMKQRGRDYKTSNKIAKEEIINWYTRICGICNTFIEDKYHIDHKTPLSKGGLHEVSNLQLAHPKCNLKKRDKIVD